MFLGRSTRGNSSISTFSLQVNLGDSHSSRSCKVSPERIKGGEKNQTKNLPARRCSGRDTIPIGHSVGPALSSKYVVPGLHICTPPKLDEPNTPKRIRIKLIPFKRSHQYCLKDMKREGKIKIDGRDFILVPKINFLNLLQSLCNICS